MNPDSAYLFVDIDPAYPGGDNEFFLMLQENLHFSANSSQMSNVTLNGYFSIVSFIIEKDGSVSNIKKDTRSQDFYLIDEITAALYNMPAWTPGRINDTIVRTEVFVRIELVSNNQTIEAVYYPLFPESQVLGNKKFNKKNTKWALLAALGVIGLFFLLINSNK